MRLVWGTVDAVLEDGPSVQRLRVSLDEAASACSAVCYPALCGRCAVGERVLCNTTAVDLGLGTGGEHFVVAVQGDGVAFDQPSGGHIMKLRYTPLQRDVVAVEEPVSPFHSTMADARTLDGMPVVCCGLHSHVAIVAAAAKEREPGLRIAYVMTDEAALPLAVSRLVPQLRSAGLVDTTITAGQSFGGEHEAVNLYSGLLAARHVAAADIAVVAIGPGIPGTATPFGHGGIAQGEALNAACALGGMPIAALRVSFADTRERHVPVSHQTLTALVDVALRPVVVAVPELDAPMGNQLEAALADAGVWDRHTRTSAPALLPDTRGVDVRTMRRSVEDDPAFFMAAAAAGTVAADVTLSRR